MLSDGLFLNYYSITQELRLETLTASQLYKYIIRKYYDIQILSIYFMRYN